MSRDTSRRELAFIVCRATVYIFNFKKALVLGLKNVSLSASLGGAVTKQRLNGHMVAGSNPTWRQLFVTRPSVVSRGQHLRRRRPSCDATINDMGKIVRIKNVIALRRDGSINPA